MVRDTTNVHHGHRHQFDTSTNRQVSINQALMTDFMDLTGQLFRRWLLQRWFLLSSAFTAVCFSDGFIMLVAVPSVCGIRTRDPLATHLTPQPLAHDWSTGQTEVKLSTKANKYKHDLPSWHSNQNGNLHTGNTNLLNNSSIPPWPHPNNLLFLGPCLGFPWDQDAV